MPKYKITGIDQEIAKAVTLELETENVKTAAEFANNRGLEVSNIELVVQTEPAAEQYDNKRLSQCIDCGLMISKTAKTCPHCGSKNPSTENTPTEIVCGCLALGFLAVVVFVVIASIFV